MPTAYYLVNEDASKIHACHNVFVKNNKLLHFVRERRQNVETAYIIVLENRDQWRYTAFLWADILTHMTEMAQDLN